MQALSLNQAKTHNKPNNKKDGQRTVFFLLQGIFGERTYALAGNMGYNTRCCCLFVCLCFLSVGDATFFVVPVFQLTFDLIQNHILDFIAMIVPCHIFKEGAEVTDHFG